MAHITSKNFLREIVKPTDPDVDIIAVHGLNPTNEEFHAEETWTAADTGKLWLKDFLPARLPRARILLFGYNSNVAFRASTAGVREQAENLLNRLYMKRKDAPARPIIFLCHSLGGIIVKRALVDATLNRTYESIRKATCGIAFFATPHRGGNYAKLGDVAVSIIRAVVRKPENSFMEALKHDSLFADDLVRDFRHQLEEYYILSFHETVPSKKLGLIVDDKSATLGLPGNHETQIPVDADHSSICKFSSADDDVYEQVADNIVHLVELGVKAIREQEQLESLRTPSTLPIQQHVPAFIVPYSSNPDFVGREEIFEKLKNCLINNENEASGFHARAALYGLGGVGKSQIAIKLAHWVHRNVGTTSVFWIHASDVSRFQQGMAQIASTCKVPGTEDPKSDTPILVKTWLEGPTSGKWLMIIDNADDHEIFFRPASSGNAYTETSNESESPVPVKLATLIPACAHGTILVTTRFKHIALDITRGPNNFEVFKMSISEAVDLMRKELECLPLALTQAAAYMQRNTLTAIRYIELLKDSDEQTVARLSEPFEDVGQDSGVPNAVTATWMMTFKQIKAQYSLAGGVLSLMAFFNRQKIPQSLLLLSDIDVIALEEALGVLKSFSLVSFGKADRTYNLHRLIQVVMQKWLRLENESDVWAEKPIRIISNNFPGSCYKKLEVCALYLPHSLAALRYTERLRQHSLARADDSIAMPYQCTKKAWTSESRFLGQEDPRTLRSISKLSFTYKEMGRLRESEDLLVQGLKAQKRILGVEHPDTHKSMMSLAEIYVRQWKYDEAEDLISQALEFRKRVLGLDDPDTLNSMSHLAAVFSEQGRRDEAEELELQVMKSSGRVLGPVHPTTLNSMGNLAAIYLQHWKLDAAETLETYVVQHSKRVLGLYNQSTLHRMSILAAIYSDQERHDEAEDLKTQVLDLQTQVLGSDHPSTMCSLQSLAITCGSQGKNDKAEALFRQSLEAKQRVLGSEHPLTLMNMQNLATCWQNQGHNERAMAMLQDVVKMSKRVLGLEHQGTLDTMQRLVLLLRDQGDNERAMAMQQDIVRSSNKVLVPDHPRSLVHTKWLEEWQLEFEQHLEDVD
ncbi:MAG: hypothetical protein M1836_005861 [Candelina mexicana]|nr:MAG: hypothetical protein M1836_005861 [Candelina mexicana]